MSAADIFMSSILRTAVLSLEPCFMQVDWLNFIGISCLYQHWAVVRVPVVLADNTATPSLTAPIISQSASRPGSRPAATPPTHSLITKRVMALLYQHTSAKNITHKAATSAAEPQPLHTTFLVPSGKKLDAATCQLNAQFCPNTVMYCSCVDVRQAWASLFLEMGDSAKPCSSLLRHRPVNEFWMATIHRS